MKLQLPGLKSLRAALLPGEMRGQILPAVGTQADPVVARLFGGIAGVGFFDEEVTVDRALSVPAVGAAVRFLSRSIATLPIGVYKRGVIGREKLGDHPFVNLLQGAVNDTTTRTRWLTEAGEEMRTYGRSVTFIERNGRGDVINLWPLPIEGINIGSDGRAPVYHFRDGVSANRYDAADVIDLKFMGVAGKLTARSPIQMHRDTIAAALAITRYESRFFNRDGVPLFVMEGPFDSAASAARATADVDAAITRAAQEGRQFVGLPDGHKINPLSVDPDKMQMIEAKRFVIEEIARIYSLPPVFLQDLTHGTFSNTEQQDLHLVKHTLAHDVRALESELNLKLFGRGRREFYVEMNMAGLLRGDFKSMMEARSQGIQNAQLTPNEARELDNRPPLPGGDQLMVQGATVPLAGAGQSQEDDNGS